MFIELVDALRCPVPHEESWLVAATSHMESRHIVEGTLGCPVCRAEYPIRAGVVDFRRPVAPPAAGAARADARQAVVSPGSVAPEAGRAMRLAALLDLADGQGFAVLLGAWGAHASALAQIVETPLILIDPPSGIVGAPGISVLRSDGMVPLATGAARALALADADASRAGEGVRATRTGGRVLGPAQLPVPPGVRELARDADGWLAEREAATSPLVTLHVRRGV